MIFPVHSSLKNTRRGFTLIEILVVIAIIGILSSVVLASLAVSRAKARDARRIADLEEVKKALELYYDSNGTYPETQTGSVLPNVLKTQGFIAQIPVSPPGVNPYKYYGTEIVGGQLRNVPVGLPTGFVLDAQLERTDNVALTADVDVLLYTNVGGGPMAYGASVDCGDTLSSPERCFDIRP